MTFSALVVSPAAAEDSAAGTWSGTWQIGHYSGEIEFTIEQNGKKLTGAILKLTGMPHDPGKALTGTTASAPC